MLASGSSSSSSATAADMIQARTYDVFLSFRGKDTRDGFVSYLYKDLCRKNIETFIDDEELRKGDEISGALLTAIQGSRVSVIVFSKDYASSKWCLAELVKIMDCNKWVVPVFYGVDPRDIRNQTGSFAEAFAKHEENFKHELEKVKTWRSALTAAGKLSGWDSQVTRPDSTLVDKIVEDIVKKLNCGTSSANLKGLVGIERRMQEVLSLFQDGFPDFRMLGFWGMGGIGKTTLADAIYHHVSNGFQRCCFLANVREHDEQRELLKLRNEFLSTILEDENLYISTPTIGSGFLKDRLSKKKVLIVCDDVSKLSQLEFLFGGIDRFGPESRVIVTTRNKQVLIQCGIDLIYEVKELDEDESVQLFCQCAFKSNNPIEYQLEVSQMVLSVANGNPLAIRLIGSSLCGKTQSYQESEVKKLKQVPKQDIQNVLKWSFDALDCEEKEMFLDIACFFKGKDRDHVTSIMDACYVTAHSGIENLVEKSLISVSQNQIAMHDLLQQMGWNIVRDESPLKPEKRSRLCIPEDSYNVLSENNGTETLTGIVLDMSNLPKLELEPTALMKIRKLRFLKFYHSCGRILLFKGLLSFPNELRYLYWDGYPLRSLPTKFDLRYLVELDMRWSHLEQLWEGKQDLVNLKILRLNGSQNLVRIPDLSSATNLEKIDLCGCSNLRELPSSLQHLEKLTFLNFKSCKNLRSLPSFYKATSLTELDLRGCSNLYSFPEIMDTMESLRYLYLSGTALKELPSSIENLIGLKQLRLKNCKKLVCLPDSFYKLKSLESFYLKGCSRLETFPEIIDNMEMLRKLDLKGSNLKELPSSIDNLISLVDLKLKHCKNLVCLPDSFYKLKSLEIFCLEGCSRLETFPEIMDTMERLRHLSLRGTALKELPSSIDNLIGLEELVLNNCENLVCLPDNFYKLKSLKQFILRGCSRLEIFPEVMDTMEMLVDLDLSRTALKELPSSVENLIGLQYLILENCENLVCLPDSFYKLKALKELHLQGCSRLEIFPEVMDIMERLSTLYLSKTALKELPSSIGNLIGLKYLRLANCENLIYLPNSFYKLKSLCIFSLEGCSRLEIFPEVMDTMEMLMDLDLSGTTLMELPSSIGNLIGLENLSLNNCENLVCLPDSFYKLKSLYSFTLQGCLRLEIFPEVMDTMEMLTNLDLSGTALKELPSSIENLVSLKYLILDNCENLVCLPESFCKLKFLEKLDLKGCLRLEIFPEILETMETLRELDLRGTALKELPSSIENLIGLEYLILDNCENLVCLPDSFCKLKFLEKLDLKGCLRLEIFPEILEIMERLRKLDLSGTALKELPSSIENLIDLKYLILDNCENLVCLPDSFYKLKSLLALSLCGSSNLVVKNLFTTTGCRPVKQKDLHGLSSLKELDLSESNLENLPTTIKQFSCLEELILRKCKRLKSLPELPPSLVYLDADDCTSLEDVSSIRKLFEQALFCQDLDADKVPSLELTFTNNFKLGEKGVGYDIDVYDSTSVFCKYLGWLFTNCFRPDQNAARSTETPKLEMPFEQMVTVLKDYHQAPPESKRRIRILTRVPGSEIPEWFDFKSLGSSINIPLPSEWWINFPCFVASVVVSLRDYSDNGMLFGIRCKCHLKSSNGDSHYLSCSFSVSFLRRLVGWDQMFVLYDDFKVWEFVKSEASSKRFYNQASFHFCLDDWNEYKFKVKQCGVHLLFGN
ncbi:hypothetical protein PVK06_041373 [Gossypium arboreum]|uniref:ADP-ribosyl cyclase/cyclic ADP-ribose hydrolase n=2 Tax=Gossypium arboreum TaxID=29729 RepID=A0ABR0N8M8_GOSAR|nr:hypothetical protein PVK06_041373 [Gossypium arboreum]